MKTLMMVVVCGFALGLFPAAAIDLGNAQLSIAGTQLSISPQSQTVPFETPTVVETTLEGFDTALGHLPSSLRVLADFTGPEIDGVLTLETVPNEPFRIPRLKLEGEYRLDNIRLTDGDDLLAYASPRSAAVLVTQVLVVRVTSRPLTLEEIRGYGIVFGDDSFQAFNFTFGFAIDAGSPVTYDYNVPIAFDRLTGTPTVLHDLVTGSPQGGGSASQRFTPPQMAPFTLQIERPAGEAAQAFGGCQDLYGDCSSSFQAPLPGVILFPTDVSLLNQFFSVVLMAGNGAPAGDPLVIRDLTVRVTLPPGLRMAQTEPPTPLGVPIPVRVPGPDGELGTGDDLNFLVAQSTGEAKVLVEGLSEGNHLVRFDLAGVLEGLPQGPQPITGVARGAVLVRDPSLGVTISHPDVVRAGEQYPLLLTVTNTGLDPVNNLQVTFPPAGLAGVELVGGQPPTIPTLASGEAEVLEVTVRALMTGKVIASAARVGGQLTPTFELTVGVGENGIPLSPSSIILPGATASLTPELVKRALGLVGLGFSLATAPPALLSGKLPQVSRATVDDRVYQLAQAGRHIALGEEPFDSAAVLALEWLGVRDADWEWDLLRRTTRRGAEMADSLAQELASEATVGQAGPALDRLASTAAYLPPWHAALAEGASASLEVVSRTSGKALAGAAISGARLRELPFAELFDLPDAELALLSLPESDGYEARLRVAGGGVADLSLVVPNPAGTLRRVRWDNVSLSAVGLATVAFQESDTSFVLAVDDDGDGTIDSQPPGLVTNLTPRPFAAMAAVQSAVVDPSGHVVEVLFSADVDLGHLSPASPSRFEVAGNLSNGGVTAVESAILANAGAAGVRGTRVVRVIFNNPVSPLTAHTITVRDVEAADGRSLVSQALTLVATVTDPGGQVTGTVTGPDGLPVPFAEVGLLETDLCPYCDIPCQQHRTAAVVADAQGQFTFDYVRQTECSEVFEIEARDPVGGYFANARARMRFAGQTTVVDVRMLGRGTLRGRVLYEDGTVPASAEVIAYSPVFGEGRRAAIDANGNYELREVPVGTITLSANDGQGHFVFATVELESAGAVTSRDLTLLRLAPAPTGDVRGFIVERDGGTPVAEAYVALYVETRLIGVLRSGADGSFDFGTVPAGTAEIQAFDGATGREGGNVYFDVLADQVTEITLPITDDRGTVEGTVLRGTGAGATPVAGAVVWIRGTAFNTVTDAAGFYRIEDVYSGDRYVHAADLATGDEVSALVTVPVPDPVTGQGLVSRTLNLPLPANGSGLAGQVIGLDGLPVEGATVHLAAGSQNWYRETFTDAAGRFTLTDLGTGNYAVHAFKGALGATADAVIPASGATPFVDLRFAQGTIRGVIKADDGTGHLVGVQSTLVYRTTVVRLGLVDLDLSERSLQTAPDGSFELTGVLVGDYELKAFNPFYEDPPRVTGTLETHGQIVEHELVFGAPGSISGVVLRPDGVTPAAGARVDLRHPAFSSYTLTADAEGRFRFELVPPQSQWIKVDAELTEGTIFRQARASLQLNRDGQHVEVALVLPAQGSVSGRVKDANGNDVPAALVTLREQEYPKRVLTATTDATGQYAFSNVFAGELSLAANAATLGGLGAQATATLSFETQAVTVVLTLDSVGAIEGEVRSPVDASLVPGAEVTVKRGNYFVDRTTTDPQGQFRFELLPLASYTVDVFDPNTGRQGQQSGLTIASNNQVVVSSVTLEARGVVTGTLTDPDTNLTVPGATVTLRTSSLIPLTTYSSTGADGMFLFEGIPQGSFTLTTQEPSGRRKASGSGAVSSEDQVVTVDLVLEATGSVTGELRNPPGQPYGLFANANTRIVQDGQVIGASLANPYQFDNVIVGRPFEILVDELAGAHHGAAEGTLSYAGEIKTLHVSMGAIGSARVKVYDAVGNPVNGADVRVTNSSPVYGYKILLGETGAGNEIVFTDLGAGTVGVSAIDVSSGLTTSGLQIVSLTQDGQELQVSVNLEPSGTFFGRALLSDGLTPAVGAAVTVDGPGAWTADLFTGSDGRFEIPAMPDGYFWLTIQEHLGPGYWWQDGNLAVNEVLDLGDLVLDDADPYVTFQAPAAGAVGVSVTPTVTAEISEPVNAEWFAFQTWIALIKVQGDTQVPSTRSLSADGRTLTLVPDQPLLSDTLYRAEVRNGLFDLAGRHLANTQKWTFRSADVVSPSIVTAIPADGAIEVPVSVQPYLQFSELMDTASLGGGALQLTDLTTGLGAATTAQIGAGGVEVTLTPVEALEVDHQYRLTIQGATDTSGNPLPLTEIEFWTPDPEPPEIGATTPAPGTAFVAGQSVSLSAQVTDNRGVAAVTFHLGGGSAVVTAPPYEATLQAPAVTAPEDVTILVEATDEAGNLASTSWTITVSPAATEPPPEVSYQDCLSDGDFVLANVARPVGYLLTDEAGLASWELRLDGQVVDGATLQGEASLAGSYAWTPPVSANAGDSFTFVLEASDFGGNLVSKSLTFVVATGTLLSGGGVLDSYTGASLVLASGTYTVTSPASFASLALLPGATLKPVSGGTVALSVSGTLRIQCDAKIDVAELGYAGGAANLAGAAPAWVAAALKAGGSHGGAGGTHTLYNGTFGQPGAVYDSVHYPTLPGGGGSTYNAVGGAGGGVVRVSAAEIVVGGQIVAAGKSLAKNSGGAGGAVLIEGAVVRGGGVIDARGGNSTSTSSGPGAGGGGGGGRIAVLATAQLDFDPATQAWIEGGWYYYRSAYGPWAYAAAGTAFVQGPGDAYGRLVVANGLEVLDKGVVKPALIWGASELPPLGGGLVTATEAVGADLWITGEVDFLPRWIGARMVLLDGSGQEAGDFRVAVLGTDGRLLLSGAGAVTSVASYRGEYRFDRLDLLDGGGLWASDPLFASEVFVSGEGVQLAALVADEVTIGPDAVLAPAADRIDLTVSGDVVLSIGARIDLSGRGYPGGTPASQAGGAPAGVAASGIDGGGSHGGVGGAYLQSGALGEVFDSVYQPELPGGGGSLNSTSTSCTREARAGGGALRIEADTVTLDGDVSSNGGSAITCRAAAGGGGSVWIAAGTVSGGGSIEVGGGTSSTYYPNSAGSGAGGRVAIVAGQLDGFDPYAQATAYGGVTVRSNQPNSPSVGGPGTVYWKTAADLYGHLKVAHGSTHAPPITPLPAIGAGTVGAVIVDSFDPNAVWIEPQDANQLFSYGVVGMWARVDGLDFQVIDQSADRRSILLADATGAVAEGDLFVGVYKLDTVYVEGGATLEFRDPAQIGVYQVDGSSTVIEPQ